MPHGSLLSETYRGKSLRKQKFESKTKNFTDFRKEGLKIILTRDLGLGVKVSNVLVNRPIAHFERIQEFINGLVDALWLANEQVFLSGSKEELLIRKLVRKIFAVGSTNLVDLVDQWKEWTNFLFHTVAETVTIGQLQKPAPNNIFRLLNGIPYINMMYQKEYNMLLLQHMAHLTSTRQMPYMGLKTEERSRKEFKEVLTSDYKPPEDFIFKISCAARRIGSICRTIKPRLNPGESHVSVTSSGEYSHPISKGGQAAGVIEGLRRILLEVPTEDRIENTPFGPAKHCSGIPLWKTLFRKIPVPPEQEFLESYYLIKEQPGRFRGLDEDTGSQMMYVAWRELKPIPVLRAEVVPEMGNKARHVTISDYWLNILQAPLAHLLIDSMKYHPSVFSSFHRQDQAWEAVKAMCRKKGLSLPPGHFVLSSDLKDATNAQQWEITKAILRAYIQGAKLSFRTEYVDLVLETIGPRLVLFSDTTSVLSKVGIMMGEAIAKPSLTLLNLSIEELSFLEHCSAEEILYTEEPAPYREWRFLHIGGDDHLAMGPSAYLDRITCNHRLAGSHISPGKHGYSRKCVKYTERILNLENFKYMEPFNRLDYSHSIIVDSVKVRLLEKGQSTMIKKDNKNVAIGKSKQLGGVLNWLPKDNRFFTETKKASIRALFVERMGDLLPKKAVNPRAYAAIHLPDKVGGYGLGMTEELQKFLSESPEPHQGLIYKAFLGLPVKKDLRIFRTLNTNIATRGVESILELQERIIGQLSDYPNMINAISWKELRLRFPDPNWNARKTIALAADQGILSIEEFAKRATRGNLFQELLLGKEERKSFNTKPYVITYKNKVWPYAEDEEILSYAKYSHELTNEDIVKAIDSMVPQWYFDVNQVTSLDYGHWDPENPETETWDFGEDTYINKYTQGLPSMSIPPYRLGIKIDRSEHKVTPEANIAKEILFSRDSIELQSKHK
jgi:hypothetical protein